MCPFIHALTYREISIAHFSFPLPFSISPSLLSIVCLATDPFPLLSHSHTHPFKDVLQTPNISTFPFPKAFITSFILPNPLMNLFLLLPSSGKNGDPISICSQFFFHPLRGNWQQLGLMQCSFLKGYRAQGFSKLIGTTAFCPWTITKFYTIQKEPQAKFPVHT